VQKEILPAFLRSGFGTVITGATVLRLTADRDRRISTAEVATLDGQKGSVRARLFVVCCGGFESRACCCSRLARLPEWNSNGMTWWDAASTNTLMSASMHAFLTVGKPVPTTKLRTHQFYQTYRSEGLGALIPAFRQAWLLPNHILPFRLVNVPRNVISALGASRTRRYTLVPGPR